MGLSMNCEHRTIKTSYLTTLWQNLVSVHISSVQSDGKTNIYFVRKIQFKTELKLD